MHYYAAPRLAGHALAVVEVNRAADLIERALLEPGQREGVQFPVRKLAFAFPYRLGKAVRQRTIERAADMCVRGRLRVAATGDEHLGDVHLDDVAAATGSLARRTHARAYRPSQLSARLRRDEIPGIRQIAGNRRGIGRHRRSRVRTGMTAVHDDREADPRLEPVEGGSQPVVRQRVLPVQIGGTENLVPAIGLVADLMPIYADNRILVRGEKNLFCLGN